MSTDIVELMRSEEMEYTAIADGFMAEINDLPGDWAKTIGRALRTIRAAGYRAPIFSLITAEVLADLVELIYHAELNISRHRYITESIERLSELERMAAKDPDNASNDEYDTVNAMIWAIIIAIVANNNNLPVYRNSIPMITVYYYQRYYNDILSQPAPEATPEPAPTSGFDPW